MDNDLISRSALLENECCGRISGDDVRNAPAVDAVPVRHGRWKYLPPTYTLNGSYTCTACGSISWNPHINKAKYCPFCGAEMDAEEETHEQGV